MRSLTFGLFFAFLSAAVWADHPPVRMLAHGWDTMSVSTKMLLDHADLFDELPIDGVPIMMKVRGSTGSVYSGFTLPYDKKWEYAAFSNELANVREILKHPSLKHSFLQCWFGLPKWGAKKTDRMPLTDDAGWERFAHNFAMLARMARETGAEGILIDNEDYSACKQYYWFAEDGDFESMRKLARRRGAQVFGAAYREHPELKTLFFWLLSFGHGNYLHEADVVRKRNQIGDLWPDFVNGILDVIPREARLIDGNECSYYFRADRLNAFRDAKATRDNVLPLIEPENRTAYRGQLLVSSSQYLDMYDVDRTGGEFYQPPKEGGTRLDRFVDNICQTAETCEGYLWLYGEKRKFIHWKDTTDKRRQGKTWDEMMPGMYDAIAYARSPADLGRRKCAQLAAAGALSNLVACGTCAIAGVADDSGFKTNRFAKGIESWQHEKTPGVLGTDTSVGRGDKQSVCLDGVKRGCGMIFVDGVKPGEKYVARVYGRGVYPNFSVGFYENKRQCVEHSARSGGFAEAGADGWREGTVYVIVPEGVNRLCVFLGCDQDGKNWYDDIGVYRDK